MSPVQLKDLKEKLYEGQFTTSQVKDTIRGEFEIQYTMKQVWVIPKKMGMKHAKPYPLDNRRPDNAEKVLKNLGKVL